MAAQKPHVRRGTLRFMRPILGACPFGASQGGLCTVVPKEGVSPPCALLAPPAPSGVLTHPARQGSTE